MATIIILLVVVSIGAYILYLYLENIEKKKKQEEYDKRLKELSKPYKEYSKMYDEKLKEYQKNPYYLEDNSYHYAIMNNKILQMFKKTKLEDIIKYLSRDIPKVYDIEYDIDEIKYYRLVGSVYQQQYITGGGGGGSSIGGAVVGSLVAGDVGAIIGSRKKVDNIKTTYETKDDRELELTFKDDTTITMSYKFYDKLLEYIPEKEYDNYIANKKAKGRK